MAQRTAEDVVWEVIRIHVGHISVMASPLMGSPVFADFGPISEALEKAGPCRGLGVG